MSTSLQEIVLDNYKKLYPHSTLRSISLQTGIQVTRIFRILNGYEMKLHEYERFKKCLDISYKKSVSKENLYKLANQCSEILSEDDLHELNSVMERKIHIQTLVH